MDKKPYFRRVLLAIFTITVVLIDAFVPDSNIGALQAIIALYIATGAIIDEIAYRKEANP